MLRLTTALTLLAAAPAFAAGGEDKAFISLANTDFVVLIAFLLFIGVLFYFRVPALLMGLLDKRADGIRAELAEARALQEEAQSVLAQYERKHKEVAEQAERIVSQAKAEAEAAAEQAKEDLKASIARRLQAAEDQIASAEASAVKEVRDRAVQVAVAAASDLVTKGMSADDASKLIEESITTVGERLN